MPFMGGGMGGWGQLSQQLQRQPQQPGVQPGAAPPGNTVMRGAAPPPQAAGPQPAPYQSPREQRENQRSDFRASVGRSAAPPPQAASPPGFGGGVQQLQPPVQPGGPAPFAPPPGPTGAPQIAQFDPRRTQPGQSAGGGWGQALGVGGR